MKRFKNIIFVPDPKGRHRSAFERALALAIDNDATLTVFDAIDQYDPEIHRSPPMGVEELMAIVTKARERAGETLAKRARANEVTCKIKVVVGKPAVEIVRQVLRDDHDLLVKAATGESGRLGGLFGGLDLFLMRKCPCPIWIFNDYHKVPVCKVMAAIDPPSDAYYQSHLTETILTLANGLVEADQAELHVGHAWTLFHEGVFKGNWLHLPRRQVELHAEKAEAFHRKAVLDEVNAHARPGVSTTVHIRRGDPREVLPKLVEELDIDLLILGTLCRTGIPGFFIGNTAETILNKVDCSVLCLKPAGFTSSITL